MTEEILGGIVLAAWAALVLWGIVEMARSAARREQWPPSFYVVGLIGACAIGAGSVMTLRAMLPDVFGLGFLLAAGGGLAIWGVGYATARQR
jgi:hypothetical protein